MIYIIKHLFVNVYLCILYSYVFICIFFIASFSATPCEPESRRQHNRLGMEYDEDIVGAGSEWSYICLLHKKGKRENILMI